ncbi:methyltransferase [Thalassotalea fusca]
MLSPFFLLQAQQHKPLHLERFPTAQINRSLQAWDAADEYLINYVRDNNLVNQETKILIINDSFGALAINFPDNNVYQFNDSYVSQQGTLNNYQLNNLDSTHLNQLTSLDELPDEVDIILFKIPKSKQYMTDLLARISAKYSDNVIFIAADKAKQIQKNTLAIFEQFLGTTTTSLAVKKARLVFCQLNNKHTKKPSNNVLSWQLDSPKFTISNLSNVFAREKLDIGGRFFIVHLPTVNSQQSVIDLGCGNGVVGLTVLAQNANSQVTFVDESFMAVKSAQMNVAQNFPEAVEHARFIADDCLTSLESQTADLILCNPPFHQQNAVTDHIAWQMFKDSFRVLRKNGELRIVGNRQLGYHIKLQRLFGNCETIASNSKFVILSAIKK